MMGSPKHRWPVGSPMLLGVATIAALVGGLGAWSVGTQLSGAIIAPGTVRVQSDRQVVQHPDGGVAGAILVRDGDRVGAGDVLLRLDGTFLKSELDVVESQLVELYARKKRLEAERDMERQVTFDEPPAFSRISSHRVAEQLAGQERLFEARVASMEKELEQLEQQRVQIRRQAEGIEAQLTAAATRLGIAEDELADLEHLFERGLVPLPRVLERRKEVASLGGEIGQLRAAHAEAHARVAQLAIQELHVANSRREDAITELRDLAYTEIELAERQASLAERLSRLDIRAPVGGTVFESSVFALNSVVRAAEPVMYIVPDDQPLQIEARIDPIDVDQVIAGQDVNLVFSAFDRRTTPEVPGRVRLVSADTSTDEATGAVYYEAVIEPTEAIRTLFESEEVLPGMPVESYIVTDERTPLSYLVRPLTIYFSRAMREE